MNANRTRLAALSVLASATILVACDRTTTTTTTPAGTTTTPSGTTSTTSSTTTTAPSTAASNAMSATNSAMSKAGDAVSDSAVTGKVKTALLADDDVKGLKIDVDTKDGVVTLNGTADTSAHSQKATTIARGIEGVKSVENKLTVKP
jgi:hyperosmotically inducible protein